MAVRKKRRRRAHRMAQQQGDGRQRPAELELDSGSRRRAGPRPSSSRSRRQGKPAPGDGRAQPLPSPATAAGGTNEAADERPSNAATLPSPPGPASAPPAGEPAAGAAEPARAPILRVWRNRNYALFEGGWTPNSITSWIQRVGVTWLAWELSHSNAWVGAVAAADLAPMIVLAPLAGAIADRSRDPLRLLKAMKVLLLVQAVALAWLAAAGLMTIELLFVLSLATGLIHPFASATRQIVLASSVPREDFASAIALDSALFQASRFVGPAIAAVMIGVWGVASTFHAHVVGSVVVIMALLLIRMDPPDRQGRFGRSLLIDIAESIRYARGHGAIWPLFLLLTVASTLLRPVQDLLPGFASNVFASGAEGLGWLASAMGAGAMLSATLIALRGRVDGLGTWAIAGGLILVLATFGFAASDQLWLGILFAGITAFGLNTLSTSIQTITQSVVSDNMRGRVMSLYSLIFRGMPAIGALVLGATADRIGLGRTFAIAALLSLGVWGLVALRRAAINVAVGSRQ